MRRTTHFFAALLCTALAAAATAQEIDRIEPPFWWTGFEHRELQLMIHGNNISLLTPAVDHAGVSIDRVVRVESPNYLFVYLDIAADAEPGTFDIAFSEGAYAFTRTYELRQKSTDPEHTRGFTSADAIYLVMPVGKLSLRHALIGGITAALLWEITRHILVWYFSTLSLVNVVYGAFATVIIILLSLEAGAIILLLGAQVIAEYERIGSSSTTTHGLQT